jgi:lipid II:glycine glycyltransferase (peptidoglycan interpeptide bridge formation enzyme)
VVNTFTLNPLEDSRWEDFVLVHAQASVFHSSAWLRALRNTYGYEPIVFTTTPPRNPLMNGIVFCRVRSWLTGSRLVSVPFADHCQPLVSSPEEFARLVNSACASLKQHHCDFLELRPRCAEFLGSGEACQLASVSAYYAHTLDLGRDQGSIFSRFHKSCVRSKIRRADREGLTYESGRSEPLLEKFYGLLLLTRQRHGIPPQPIAWFRNLLEAFGNGLSIHIAALQERPVAGMMTLRHKSTLTYKYGCSDARFHPLGGMPWLFWRIIREAKDLRAARFDLGRSDANQRGLIEFKNRLGAEPAALNYYRAPARFARHVLPIGSSLAPAICRRLPQPLFRAAGALLYRHAA